MGCSETVLGLWGLGSRGCLAHVRSAALLNQQPFFRQQNGPNGQSRFAQVLCVCMYIDTYVYTNM